MTLWHFQVSYWWLFLVLSLLYVRFPEALHHLLKAIKWALSINYRVNLGIGIVAVLTVVGCAWHAHETYHEGAEYADLGYMIGVALGAGEQQVAPGREYSFDNMIDFMGRCEPKFGYTGAAENHCRALLTYVENAVNEKDYSELTSELRQKSDYSSLPEPVQTAIGKFFF
jgi:hypothetical protein